MRNDIRKPRRSVLYVPGSNQKALDKSASLDVDALIYDLEDSVSLSAKNDARNAIIELLENDRLYDKLVKNINDEDIANKYSKHKYTLR